MGVALSSNTGHRFTGSSRAARRRASGGLPGLFEVCSRSFARSLIHQGRGLAIFPSWSPVSSTVRVVAQTKRPAYSSGEAGELQGPAAGRSSKKSYARHRLARQELIATGVVDSQRDSDEADQVAWRYDGAAISTSCDRSPAVRSQRPRFRRTGTSHSTPQRLRSLNVRICTYCVTGDTGHGLLPHDSRRNAPVMSLFRRVRDTQPGGPSA